MCSPEMGMFIGAGVMHGRGQVPWWTFSLRRVYENTLNKFSCRRQPSDSDGKMEVLC